MKPLITVVIPIYNVEKYLDRCVQSIVDQTYSNLEIILVDDGSPDNCPQICDEWEKRDHRIKVIHKKNAGLGMARNTGIDNATGDYICFFDSDDYIELDLLEKCSKDLQKNNADIVCFGAKNINNNGDVVNKILPYNKKKIYMENEVVDQFLPELIAPDPKRGGKPRFIMSAWSSVFSCKIINDTGWRFASERKIISEDVYSLLSLYKNVKCVSILSEPLYCYCENGSSLTRSYRADRYERIKHFYNESIKLAERLNYSDDIKHRLSKPYLAFTIAALKQEVMVEDKKNNILKLKSIIDDELLQKILEKNKHDKVSKTRKILFWAIRNRQYKLCYLLLKLK